MENVLKFFRKISHSKALEDSSGYLETSFFESLYRIAYISGLSSCNEGFAYAIYWCLCGMSMYIMISLEVLRAWVEFEDFGTITDCVTTSGMQIICLVRYWGIKLNNKTFVTLGRAMESPHFDVSTKERYDILEFWIQENHKYLKMVYFLGNITIVTWTIYPLVDDLEYNLPLPVYAPYNYQTPLRFYGIYFLISIFMNVCTHVVMINDLTAQCYLTHLICQFQVLGNCFENIIEECREGMGNVSDSILFKDKVFLKRYLSKMDRLIQQHEFLLSNSKSLIRVFSAPMLCQLAFSWMLITFIGYQTVLCFGLNSKFFVSFLYLGYSIMQLYLICSWCDLVKFHSEQIGAAVYNSGWERAGGSLVRCRVAMIIARASRPVVFTAGGMYDLLLPSFGSLLNASYSALTILLSNSGIKSN